MMEKPFTNGFHTNVGSIRALTDKLNAKVQDQVNETQELVMLNNFSKETNESVFKKCLVERMSDIESWRWVLEDLLKRIDDAQNSLNYEHNAAQVVCQRLDDEISLFSQGSVTACMGCTSDSVEHYISQELNFLRSQKKMFEKLVMELESQLNSLQKTKNRIVLDIQNKCQALNVEERCVNISHNSCKMDFGKRKKKRGSTVCRWENRCLFLKRAGLKALSGSLIVKQQVRGARVHLSIAAQAYGARVDSALRRRIYANKIKLQDLQWQKEEALRDYKSLQDELETTESNILETMEQERLVEARRTDRSLRPGRELTRDDVDKNLRIELERQRCFMKQLRENHSRITSLQQHLKDSLTRIDCCAYDLARTIGSDEERIQARGGDIPVCTCEFVAPPMKPQRQNTAGSETAPMSSNCNSGLNTQMSLPVSSSSNKAQEMASLSFQTLTNLSVINEEEEDDYPFDD